MEQPRASLMLFEGKCDVTFKEIEIWRKVFDTITTGNEMYVGKLTEAKDILKDFYDKTTENRYEHTGDNTKPAAERLVELLSIMVAYHKNALGDSETFQDPNGDYKAFLRLSDKVFEHLKKTSQGQLKEHKKLEKAASEAWKYYQRRVKKKQKLSKKLMKTTHIGELKEHKTYRSYTRKMNLSLTQYNIHYENEVKKREDLAEKTQDLQKDFLKEEKRRLDVMFASINDLLAKLEKVVPKDMELPHSIDFDPEVPRIRAMAREGWQDHLFTHTFPEYKYTDNILDGDEGNGDDDLDDDEDENDSDEDSDEDEDVTHDAPTVRKPFRREERFHMDSSHHAGRHKTNINEALKEIWKSLGEDPEQVTNSQSHTTEPSPRRKKCAKGDDCHLMTSQRSHKNIDVQDKADISSSRMKKPKRSESRKSRKENDGDRMSSRSHDARRRRRLEQNGANNYGHRKQRSEETADTPVQDLASDRENQRRDSHHRRLEQNELSREADQRSTSNEDDEDTAENRTKSSDNTDKVFHHSNKSRVGQKENITVIVTQERDKQKSDEISLRVGMKIKQTKRMNASGMAYGYKKTKLGLKKFGYYPVDNVTLFED